MTSKDSTTKHQILPVSIFANQSLNNRCLFDFSSFYSMAILQSFVRLSEKVSSKSRSRQLLSSLDESRSRQPVNFPVSLSLGLDNLKILWSRWVSVSTTSKNSSLVKSRSRDFEIWVSVSVSTTRLTCWSRWSQSRDHKLGLANLCFRILKWNIKGLIAKQKSPPWSPHRLNG